MARRSSQWQCNLCCQWNVFELIAGSPLASSQVANGQFKCHLAKKCYRIIQYFSHRLMNFFNNKQFEFLVYSQNCSRCSMSMVVYSSRQGSNLYLKLLCHVWRLCINIRSSSYVLFCPWQFVVHCTFQSIHNLDF